MEFLVKEMKFFGFDRGYIFFLFCGLINFRGGVFVFLVDILVSNKVGGFKESVGGGRRKCRYCMVNFEDMQVYFIEEDFDLRDIDEYK